MIKNILFCRKNINANKDGYCIKIYNTILTDVFVPVIDIISPQKTTLKIPKIDNIEISDIIIIMDNDNGKVEYIGYIDTIKTQNTTEISCYPLINVFDNDYVLDQMYEEIEQSQLDGNGTIKKDDNGNIIYKTVDSSVDVYNWLSTQITREFIETDDYYQALPFVIRNKMTAPVFYKNILDTANLFEVYVDIFINTGVYLNIDTLKFNNGEIEAIYCDVCCNKEENSIYLRYDNPQIQEIEIVDNTFTNYNKLLATQEQQEDENGVLTPETPLRYTFYLLNDNSITTDSNAAGRIKQVRSKEISFTLEELDKTEIRNELKEIYTTVTDQMVQDEILKRQANSLMLRVYQELQASEYNLNIAITMFRNDKFKLHKIVDFFAENGILYTSRITKLEILNDKQIKITLGALRNSLTDFKKKVEAI